MMLPRISVVIPSFNKVKYITKTLDSIFSQKYSNVEVIIQDGGSTDGTLEQIKSFMVGNNIVLESKPDGGQLNAINLGMEKATGEILTFINADDYYESNAFNLISNAYLKETNPLWFAGRGRVVNENNIEIAKLISVYKNFLLSLNSKVCLLVTNYLIQPSIFFTKEAYKKYGPFTGTSKFVMEYEFWLRLVSVKDPYVIKANLSNFRIESTTKTKTMFNEILYEDTQIVKKYTKNNIILFIHDLHNLGRKVIGRFI